MASKANQPTQKLTEELIEHLQKENIETVIIACTELFFLPSALKAHFKCVDSSQVLAIEVVKVWKHS